MRSRWVIACSLAATLLASGAHAAEIKPGPAKLPVLLVHGIDDTQSIFEKLSARLRQAGRTRIYAIDMFPNNGDRSLRDLARQVSDRAASIRQQTGASQIDLVGFSMGAMVSRYYLQKLGGADRVRRFVSVAAPNRGTVSAFFRWNAGATDMRPYSQFLKELDESESELGKLEVTTIWTPFDMMIIPSFSSRLRGARERVVAVPAHPWMVQDDKACQAIVETLER